MGPDRVLLVVLTITLVCSGLATNSQSNLKKKISVRDLLVKILVAWSDQPHDTQLPSGQLDDTEESEEASNTAQTSPSVPNVKDVVKTSPSVPNVEGVGWSQPGFSTNDQCYLARLRGDQYTQLSLASDDLPIKPNCGRRRELRGLLELLLQSRIVGGQESTPGQWPWLAAIGSKAWGQDCGATLISDQWVLTAAHCFDDYELVIKPCDQNVRLGEYNLDLNDGQHADVTPSEIIIHPDYDIDTVANDIALIKLSKPAAMSDYINVACLPADVDDIDKSSCVVAGWGTTSDEGDSSSTVMHVSTPILPQSVCENAYPGELLPGMMCAGQLQGGKDSCQGDSGGPLMCKSRSSGQYLVAGVVSWGVLCGAKRLPGIYTDVLKYIDWIEWVISKY